MRPVIALLAAPALAVGCVALGPGPKYEEAFVLMLGTGCLGLVCILACFAWRVRPITGALLSAACMLTVWWGTCVKVAIIYGYPFATVFEMEAFSYGAGSAGVLAIVVWGLMAGTHAFAGPSDES